MDADVVPLPPAHLGAASCDERWVAALRVELPLPDMPDEDDWFRACARVTERVEQLPGGGALLEVGICTEDEARAVVRGLLERLRWMGVVARAGIGPSLSLAQLVVRTVRRPGTVVLLRSRDAGDFLRRVPVEALLELHPRMGVTPECVERLRRYGLGTLGHVARVAAANDGALRRQFGPVGDFLAAVARGEDARPLVPTLPSARLRFRLRLPEPMAGERILALLPRWAEQISQCLRQRGAGGRTLRLVMQVEGRVGRVGPRRIRRTLREPVNDAPRLARELGRMLAAPQGDASAEALPSSGTLITALRLTLGDLAPVYPEQEMFWVGRSRRRAALEAALEPVSATLALRHGGQQRLFRPRIALPDAVFEEDRYQLAPFASAASSAPRTGKTEKWAAKKAARRMPDVADAWEHVPQRLHWW